MNKVMQGVTQLRDFIDQVRQELKKCAWPSRSELLDSTLVVIVAVLIMGVFVGLSDGLISSFLNWVIR